jgi:hypothetical protein
VGFTKGDLVGGNISNFKLEVIPEPTVISLGLLGGLALVFAGRRRA